MSDRVRAYAEWLTQNADKQGTPEFDTVANAYKKLRTAPPPEASPQKQWEPSSGNVVSADTYNPDRTKPKWMKDAPPPPVEDKSSLGGDFQAGVINLEQAGRGIGLAGDAATTESLEKQKKRLETDPTGGLGNTRAAPHLKNRDAQGQATALDQQIERRKAMESEKVGALAEGQQELSKIPQNPAAQRLGNAKTFREGWEAFMSDPYGVARDTMVRSAPASAPSVVGGIVGAVGGPLGAAAGAGAGSGIVEYGSAVMDALQNFGADLNNPQSITDTFNAHRQEILDYATKRGAIVGGADAAAGGAGAKIGELAWPWVAKFLTGLGAQIAGGAGGEAGAQIATTGGITQPGAVLAEAIGEVGAGGVEAIGEIGASEHRQQGKTNDQGLPEITVTQGRVEPSLDTQERMPDSVAADYLRAGGFTDDDIGAMTPRERFRRAQELRAQGVQATQSSSSPIPPEESAAPRSGTTPLTDWPAAEGPGNGAPLSEPQSEAWRGPESGDVIGRAPLATPTAGLDQVRTRGQMTAQGAPTITPKTPMPVDVTGIMNQARPPTSPPAGSPQAQAPVAPAPEPGLSIPERRGDPNYRPGQMPPIQGTVDLSSKLSQPGLPRAPRRFPINPENQAPGVQSNGGAAVTPEISPQISNFTQPPAADPRFLNSPPMDLISPEQPQPKALAPRGPRKPLTLLQFLASEGGLRDHRGELRHMGVNEKLIPGMGRLVRKEGGLPLDEARRRAVEAGYLKDTPYEGGQSVSSIDDLLQAIDAEHRGKPVYPIGFDPDQFEADKQAQMTRQKAERAVERFLADPKSKGIEWTPTEYARIVDYVLAGMDVGDAMERVAIEVENAEDLLAPIPAEEPSPSAPPARYDEFEAYDALFPSGTPDTVETPSQTGEGRAEPRAEEAVRADGQKPPRAREARPEQGQRAEPEQQPAERSPTPEELDDGEEYDPEVEEGFYGPSVPPYENQGNVTRADQLVTKPPEEVFPAPKQITRAWKDTTETLSLEDAKARVAEWKAFARKIRENEDHSNEVIISLFDRTGAWSQPYRDAGYQVAQYDIARGDDLLKNFPIGDIINMKDAGFDIVGVLAAPPCTSFAVSGARWWKDQHDAPNPKMLEKKYGYWASTYFDTPLEYAETLVHATEAIVGFANPSLFHVLENPIGRIQEVAGLNDPTLMFEPHNYGDPYTKKTLLWGDFNPALPQANVKPTLGSLIHKLRGDVAEQKALRSETPEGFAYAFFLANNTSKMKFEAGQDRTKRDNVPSVPPETRPQEAPSNSPEAPSSPPEEAGADNKPQLVIPGAEQIGQGEQAQRKADEPLKPKAPQKPMDDGLFGDGHKQQDLFSAPASNTKTSPSSERPEPSLEKPPVIQTENVPAAEPVDENKVVRALRDRLLDPKGGFASILEARKFAKEQGFTAEPGTPQIKQLDELIELATVKAARTIINRSTDTREAYDELVALYGRQPNLGSRTSESMADQAYSTPVPLGFLAQKLAGIGQKTKVYEPTAGNGALLTAAKPSNVTANEINEIRANGLKSQGFKVTRQRLPNGKAPSVDAVIMNPPFGAVKQDDGSSVRFDVDGWTTTQIDHAIALDALKGMADDGRAVLIVGGPDKKLKGNRQALSDLYNGKQKREFYYRLYRDYNVTDHFTVPGELYSKQGAAWPVDVIVIEGRGKSQRSLPAVEVPQWFDSWDALRTKLDDAKAEVSGLVQQQDRGSAAPEPAVEGRGERDRTDTGGRESPAPVSEPAPDVAAGVRDGRDQGQPARVREQRARQSYRERLQARQRNQRDGTLPATDTVDAPAQVPYAPASNEKGLDTLIPTNMQGSAEAALLKLEEQNGDLDTFVADRLGYDRDTLGDYFGAEQVDAIALALDNVDKGAAFIIGDQTGIGKGRVVAAMLRYAMKKKMTPVFVTEKPNLYGDMIRDLNDIGVTEMLGRDVKPLITNASVKVPLDQEAIDWANEADEAREAGERPPRPRGKFLTSGSTKSVQAQMQDVRANGLKNFDVIFTTYDQLNTVKEQETDRRRFVEGIMPDSFLVLDESHNAFGTAQTGWKKKDAARGRSEFVRDLTGKAKAVMFSSATYAKRPDGMDLYARTDLGQAVEKPSMLGELIGKGGVPMQQVVASMLAKAGQYLRRERSFDGVSYDMETAPVDKPTYAAVTKALQGIVQFEKNLKDGDAWKATIEKLKEEASGVAMDGATGDAGIQSTNFTSLMHNIVSQMLLAIKADIAADRAIEAHKNGEKPVITVANTMGSFIVSYVDDKGLSPGDEMNLSFSVALKRYLERTRQLTVKPPEGNAYHVTIPLEDMPMSVRFMYREAEKMIDAVPDLPISPIDKIKARLKEAGLSVGEITGRTATVTYTKDGRMVYAKRPDSEISAAGRKVTIERFNSGKLDALILNRAGSTGLSLHASSKFKDQKRRRMIVAQAELNIDTHMQMLGRVHRTGQVVTPSYTQLNADIPAELRPAAVLAKKMASLNANTTASRKSALSSDAVDFLNKYGDAVVRNVLMERPELLEKMDLEIPGGTESLEDFARKVTGRLTLLDVNEQEQVLADVQAAYTDLIKALDALGENELEAKFVDLKAETVSRRELKPKKGDSPFTGAVYLETVKVKAKGRAYSMDEIFDRMDPAIQPQGSFPSLGTKLNVARQLGDREVARIRQNRIPAHEQWAKEQVAHLKDEDAKKRAKAEADNLLSRWNEITNLLTPGARVYIDVKGVNMPAIVLGIDRKGSAKTPLALGSWKARLAIPDNARELELPFTAVILENQKEDETAKGYRITSFNWADKIENLQKVFDDARKEGTEQRHIITGNIVSGYELGGMRGQIINYSNDKGDVQPGVLLARGFDEKKFVEGLPVRFESGRQILRFLDQAASAEINSTDTFVTVSRAGNEYEIELPAARSTGGTYFLLPKVREAARDQFQKRGNRMRFTGTYADTERVLDAMSDAGALFQVKDQQELAKKVIGENPAKNTGFAENPPGWDTAETENAETFQAKIEFKDPQFVEKINKAVNDYARSILGHRLVKVMFTADRMSAGAWLPEHELIQISFHSPDWNRTLRHETMHAIREYGLLTKPEWAILEREAKARWMDDYDVRKRWEQHYRNITTLNDKQLEELLTEEAVAEAFADHVSTSSKKQAPGAIGKIFDKLKAFFDRLGNLFRGEGFQTADDVMNRIYKGGLKNRPRGTGPKRSFTFKGGNVTDLKQMPWQRNRYQRQYPVTTSSIESDMENALRGGRIVFDSAADVLDRQPGLKPVATAVRKFYDRTAARMGFISRELRPVLDELKGKERERALQRFEEYMRERENGRRREADALYNAMTDKEQALVEAWNTLADETGTQNQNVGVQVFDPAQGKWRPIGKVRRFFPRKLRDDIIAAMADSEKYPEVWDEIVSTLHAEGLIQDPHNEDEIRAYLTGNSNSTISSDDYFAGIEKARGERMPASFYDYSWRTAETYLQRWAEHLSRIEAFGQRATPDGDIFERYEREKRVQGRTAKYLNAVRDRVYDATWSEPWHVLAARLNALATGVQLGNWASALLNLFSGLGLNVSHMGFIKSMHGLAVELTHLGQSVATAKDMGIIVDDMLNIMHDQMQQQVPAKLSAFTTGMLKWSGFTPAEQFVRAHGMVTAHLMLRTFLKTWNQRIDSRKSLKAIAWVQRNGFDYRALLAENGQGPETSRFLRYAVNLAQGSYKVDQVPVWSDTPIGRFLFKYQKFGVQVNRAFWKNMLKPFYESVVKGGEKVSYEKNGQIHEARVRTFLPLMRFFVAMIPAAELSKAIGSLLWGGGDGEADWDEILKALREDGVAAAWALVFHRLWNASIASGALGFFGNYLQMMRDVADRQRFKSPLEPPGLGPLLALAELPLRYIEQGQITLRDLDYSLEKFSSAYRTGKRTVLHQLGNVVENDASSLQEFMQERAYVRGVTRRFSESQGIEGNKRTSPGRYPTTENTPYNRDITDALMLGRPEQAKALLDKHLKELKTEEERKKYMQSVRSSVRSQQPIVISGGSENNREAFLAWAKDHVSPENFKRIQRLDQRYRNSAKAAGLLGR